MTLGGDEGGEVVGLLLYQTRRRINPRCLQIYAENNCVDSWPHNYSDIANPSTISEEVKGVVKS